jgi:glycosyltransferase involved in cell wall biosynthesis
VNVTGWVPDLRPLLWAATVVTLPMRIGTGIKNKLLEAWSAGAAVVATPLACQGVPAEDEQNLLLGRTPAELAGQIVRLIRQGDLRARLGQAGQALVRRQFTWAAMAQRLSELAGGPAKVAAAGRGGSAS